MHFTEIVFSLAGREVRLRLKLFQCFPRRRLLGRFFCFKRPKHNDGIVAANADFLTGNRLLKQCREIPNCFRYRKSFHTDKGISYGSPRQESIAQSIVASEF